MIPGVDYMLNILISFTYIVSDHTLVHLCSAHTTQTTLK
jgi:hypothetical protein